MAGERKAASAETLSGVSGRARGRVAAVREKRRGEGRREKGRRGEGSGGWGGLWRVVSRVTEFSFHFQSVP